MTSSTPRAEALTWDWHDQPDLDQLARAIHKLSNGTVHLTKVDTGMDNYAIVLTDQPVTADAAEAAYEQAVNG